MEKLWAEAEFMSLRKPNSSETLSEPSPASTPRRAEDHDTNHADVGPCVGQPVCGCTEGQASTLLQHPCLGGWLVGADLNPPNLS